MTRIRRHLTHVFAGWLACQLAATVAPMAMGVLAIHVQEATKSECCRGEGPGKMCPMHRPLPTGARECRMTAGCGSTDFATVSVSGGPVRPVGVVIAAPAPMADLFTAFTARRPFRTIAPDLPPPRA